MANSEKQKKESKLTVTHKILIAGFAVLIIVIGIVGYFIYKSLPQPEEPAAGNSYVIDESNLGDITNRMKDQVADSMFEVNMNTSWSFADGSTASSNAQIANSSGNKYPFAFDITLVGEEEPIYTSTIVPVGNQLNKLVLERKLSAGSYDAICTYHILDKEGNEKSSLAVNVTLHIEN